MRHGFKKAKFADGQDADRMLMRKLTVNFFLNGKISTTMSKVKALKPEVEKMVTKVKSGTEADKNYLLKKLGDSKKALDKIFKDISSQLSQFKSGYTKIVKLGYRDSDGAATATLVWAHPVVMSKDAKETVKKMKAETKSEVTKKEVKNK